MSNIYLGPAVYHLCKVFSLVIDDIGCPPLRTLIALLITAGKHSNPSEHASCATINCNNYAILGFSVVSTI